MLFIKRYILHRIRILFQDIKKVPNLDFLHLLMDSEKLLLLAAYYTACYYENNGI